MPKSLKARASVVADQHVLRFDVAVDDAAAVRVGERAAQLDRDRQRVGDRQRQPIGDRSARHELHHQVAVPGGRRAEVVHGDDARVFQLREQPRLAREAGAEIGIGRALGPQHLDGDRPPEPLVARAEHAPHAAAPELGFKHQSVGAQCGQCR